MSNDKHILYIDPVKFAMQHGHWQGEIPLQTMKRLADAINSDILSGSVKYELIGGVDLQGVSFIEGKFSTTLPMTCQRCMGLMEYQIKAECKLAPVKTEQEAEMLPSSYDALVLESDEISLNEMIEDELLLCIPTASLHDMKECSVKEEHWSYGEAKETISVDADNPFAKLANLKIKK